MGTDQGKTSNVSAVGLMAELRGVSHVGGRHDHLPPPVYPGIGRSSRRAQHRSAFPPGAPLAAARLASSQRRRPDRSRAVAARLVLPLGGRYGASAYVEEMRLVRTAVGLSDVSTLGKIDVQGPDAAEFLNRVYVNGFAKLPVGKARYGVMLNDDATVLDDGTTARFAATRYFMTTTTAQAAEVMSHLEFLLQTAWTDLNVQVVSVTDEWAGMSIAGPQARAALELALPGQDFSDAALPHMGCREVDVDGMPLRILRLSFSGELAYELYVPADHGIALWERLLAARGAARHPAVWPRGVGLAAHREGPRGGTGTRSSQHAR